MTVPTLPTLVVKAFADGGSKNVIPVLSQIGVTPGAASYTDGFPPLTMTPIASGGVPPFGQDMNGILNAMSAHIFWINSGGLYKFDSTFATAIGGYPIGQVLQNNAGTSSYVNILANNSTDFNSTPSAIGVSWLPWAGNAAKAGFSAFTLLASSTSLTSSAFGAAFFITGAATTQTLPAVASAPSGTRINIAASVAATIAGNSTENIYDTFGSPSNTKPLMAGEQVTLVSNGTAWYMQADAAPGGRLINTQVFTSTGTYTPSVGTKSVVVEVQGAGGGGGGSIAASSGQSSIGGGGGAGAYAKGRITSAFSGVTVTIGTAGAAGGAGTAGGNGGTSSFGALISCPGGNGANASGTATIPGQQGGGVASSISIGANVINSVGSAGGFGLVVVVNFGYGGIGGASFFGGGGMPGGGTGSSGAGVAATNKGAGGGGAFTAASSSAQVGGAGGAGLVTIWEYS